MGAAAHLDLFNRTVAAFDSLSEEEADTTWTASLGRTRTAASARRRQAMEDLDAEFESLLETEDIIALNAAWLGARRACWSWT